jgi:hypothetical protein
LGTFPSTRQNSNTSKVKKGWKLKDIICKARTKGVADHGRSYPTFFIALTIKKNAEENWSHLVGRAGSGCAESLERQEAYNTPLFGDARGCVCVCVCVRMCVCIAGGGVDSTCLSFCFSQPGVKFFIGHWRKPFLHSGTNLNVENIKTMTQMGKSWKLDIIVN